MRRRWTELPMPKEVIACIDDALGRAQGQPKLLTFFNRKGPLIGDYDEYEIPGVNQHEITPNSRI
jgi:hypothetical protein